MGPERIIRTKDPESSQFAVDIFLNLSLGGLPVGIEYHDKDTRYFGFFPAPLFLVVKTKGRRTYWKDVLRRRDKHRLGRQAVSVCAVAAT
jgi:hypothetical protein